ncbi:MAG: helix-turn-helix transcriptional regulator [Clostridia bacterium]|nr:helix-turn-helix transcriptional regulator [Clostridia bacterium]
MENTVNFEDIGFADAVFSNISSTSQSWAHTPKYYGYLERPRPDNGLVLIASDMTALFETADGQVFEAHRGDVVFAPMGTLYKVDFYNVPKTLAVHSYTVNFEMHDREGNELVEKGGLRIITHDRRFEFLPLLAELSLACNDIRNNQLRIMSKFCAFLDAVILSTDVRAENYYPIRRGVEVLSVEWQQNELISRYADLCDISESYFHMLFKKWSGMSPVEYRNRLRVTHAKTMLQNSSMSIGEVANAVGFEDQFYFSRVFRSVTGVSPQKYRKAN